MFRIVCFVEDKNLGKALTALTGLVLNMEAPQLVVNAVVKKGKIEQAAEPTTQWEEVINTLSKSFGSKGKVLAADIYVAMADNGITRGNYSYIIKQLKKAGYLKLGKTRGTYIVL